MSDAFLELIISWFVKRLGYLVDESRSVKLGKGRPASDIDLVCMHPDNKKIQVKFLKKPLSRRLLIESKGWLEYSVEPWLGCDLKIMKGGRGYSKKGYKRELYLCYFKRTGI